MIVGNRWVQGVNAEQAFFLRALRVLCGIGRVTPRARLLMDSVSGGEALVAEGDAVLTLRREKQSVELFNDAGDRVGRWLV